MRTFTVTVERSPVDKYGEPGEPVTHEVRGCIDWPGASTESAGAFTQISSSRVLTAPAGSDLQASDSVVYPDGSRWHVVGDPYDWSNPFGKHRPGVQANLERVR